MMKIASSAVALHFSTKFLDEFPFKGFSTGAIVQGQFGHSLSVHKGGIKSLWAQQELTDPMITVAP